MDDPLEFLRNIKSVSVATVDKGRPAVRMADVMLHEGGKLYFVVARGKPYCKQLQANPEVAIVAMDENYVTIRVRGKIEFVDRSLLERIFEENPVLKQLYPGETKEILEVFCLPKGVGEVFDLSVTPPKRERFAFGGATVEESGYSINRNCISCGICKDACPVEAISEGDIYKINSLICLECGNCYEKCPVDAIDQPKEF
ncbi:4Fe-4S binding protein [Methanolobus sp. ZRKC3]|uniref:4Fe-4S binding protein n=1 Tax=Methanolobus sp. ZRKC3 TaxID=3125786 RepID=UPI003254721A